MEKSELEDYILKKYGIDRPKLEASIREDQEEQSKGTESYNACLKKRNEEIQVKLDKVIEDYLSKHPPTIQAKGRLDELHEANLKRIESQKDRIEQLSEQYQAAVNKIISKPKIAQGLKYLLPPAYYKDIQPLVGNHYLDLSNELSVEDLKSLHDPLIELNKIYSPNDLERYKFIEDRYINLKKELDLDQLKSDRKKYSIILNSEDQITGKLDSSEDNVWISSKYLYLYVCNLNGAKPNRTDYRQWRSVDKFAKRCIPYNDKRWFKHNGKWVGLKELTIDNINNPDKAEIATEEEAKIITRIASNLMPGEGRYSIAQLYKYWLPMLTLDKIRGNDLLDQILICFTMKRALNGDLSARDKLVEVLTPDLSLIIQEVQPDEINIIQRRIIKSLSGKLKKDLLQKFTKQHGSTRAKKMVLECNTTIPSERIDADEISSAISVLLTDLIGGMQPTKIIEGFIKKKEGKDISPYPPKWFFNYYVIYLLFYMRFSHSDSPYAAINDTTRWIVRPGAKRRARINSYSFIPGSGYKLGPKYNLYSWLYLESKIAQILKDYYFPSIAQENEMLAVYGRKINTRRTTRKNTVPDIRRVTQMTTLFTKYGILRKDAELYCRFKYGREKQKDIAMSYGKNYNSFRRSITRACLRVETIIKSWTSNKQETFREELNEIITS